MKTKFATVLALGFSLLSASAYAANSLAACPSARYIEPSSSAGMHGGRGNKNAPDCQRNMSANVQGGARVWRCLPVEQDATLTEGQAGNGFIIQHAGQVRQYLPHDGLPGNEKDFELIEVDLNQDANKETILAVWNAQSNGMGVHYWTIFVFDRDWKLVKRFEDVSDWGRSNVVAAPAGRRGCDIAITSYETVEGNRRDSWTALQARFFTLKTNASAKAGGLTLLEATDRPLLERRYTNSFASARTTWFSREQRQIRGDIATWLNNPATRSKRPRR